MSLNIQGMSGRYTDDNDVQIIIIQHGLIEYFKLPNLMIVIDNRLLLFLKHGLFLKLSLFLTLGLFLKQGKNAVKLTGRHGPRESLQTASSLQNTI